MPCKTVIFDYIGTLVNCKNYTMVASKEKLFSALLTEGFEVGRDSFFDAYDLAHEKYRRVRYGQLREVTNAVWVQKHFVIWASKYNGMIFIFQQH